MIILHFFHIFNKNYDSESGTKFISTDLHGGPFFVSERHNLSVLPPNQFYRTQPDSPHINPIVWV